MPAMQETQEMKGQSLGQEDPLQKDMATHCSVLAMDKGAWQATVHRVAKSWTWLKQLSTTFIVKKKKNPPASAGDLGLILGKKMATLSSILTWRIPWTERPVGLQSMRSQETGHDWSDQHSLFHCCGVCTTFILYWLTFIQFSMQVPLCHCLIFNLSK